MSTFTKLSQYQISGSHVVLDNIAVANRGKHDNLQAELNDLRSAVKDIIGVGAYTDETTIDLKTISDDFAGTLSINSASLAGTLNVTGMVTMNGGAEVAGDALEVGTIILSSVTNTITGVQMDMNDGSTATRKDYVDTAVSTEASTARSAEASLASDLSVEASTARSAEASLASDLSTEASTARSAEASLASDLSVEASTARSAEASLASDLSVEASTARSAEASLASDLSVEASTARSAEASLASDLSVEASTARSAEASVAFDLSVEASTARSAEASLASDLSVEASTARSAETSLTTALSTEASTARSAEASLASDLSVEASTARSAEASLTTALSTEASTARSAEASLASDLSTEASTARSAEASLASDLSTEASTARSAEASVAYDLSVEASTARSAEFKLTSDLSTEVSMARSAEASLASDLSVEASTARSAEASLEVVISTEVSAIVAGNYEFDHLNIAGNLVVGGDFHVSGAMTWVETENLKIKDAFIHLGLGAEGTSDSGLVLHMGNGANDFVVGQHYTNDNLLFGKMSDADVDVSGVLISLASMDLVKTSMKGVDFVENVNSASFGGINLDGVDGLKVVATNDLKLQANGEGFNLTNAAADVDTVAALEGQFGANVSLVQAIIKAGQGANFRKGILVEGTDFNAGQASLDFSAVGDLRANYNGETDIDVYLNGIMLSSNDYTVVSINTLTLGYDFNTGDVVTVVIRNAAV